jgi:Arc/MetJ family transcription regulator
MRTNIAIDRELLEEVRKGFGVKTKREAVELALRQAARAQAYEGLISLRGKLHWEGDLEAMRLD